MASTYLGKPYYPAWLDNLAEDVTGEGPAWDGAIQGAAAVHEVVVAAKEIYEFQEFHYAGPCGENSFLEDYTSSVRGAPLYVIVLVVFNAAGKAQRLGESPAAQFCAGAVPRDARKVRRHAPCQTLGRHTVRREER